MNEKLAKRPKRSFVDAWLNDERYKHWIGKVPHSDTYYYCSVCKRNFSCNTSHVSRHAESACHRNNLKRKILLSNDDDVTPNKIHKFKNKFKFEWLDIDDFKLWLRADSNDECIGFCAICKKSFVAHLSHVRRHAESTSHLTLCKETSIELQETNNDFNMQNAESFLLFDDSKKSAEIQYAALIKDRNIPCQTAQVILRFFQDIEPNVLKSMSMGRTKCSNIISNVLYPIENENIVNKLKNTKFSVFIDETSDVCNKKWMIFFARYVDPDTLDVRSQLVKLINLDMMDSSIERMFHTFKCEMAELEIPFSNIVSLSCDNTPIMTGKSSSFKTKLKEVCEHLLTLPCPCHSVILATRAACATLPSNCDTFIKGIANYIINNPKRSEIFHDFCESFQEKCRKNLKLHKPYWLSDYTCIKRLLESWDEIEEFLQETVLNDKIKSEEYLLSLMDNLETKAYFLFLKYILDFFNSFKIFFQSVETRIHMLQSKSANLFVEICQNFVKKQYLKDGANLNFSNKKIYKSLLEIVVGPDCEEYLNNLLMEGYEDIVTTVRNNCLQFYLTLAKELRKTLPITHNFLTKLQIFGSSSSLYDDDRETSFRDVSFIARTFGDFDEESLRQEWLSFPADFSMREKHKLSKLSFDDMWKEILQYQFYMTNTYKYPNLTNVLSAVRSLPNSNAHSFSDLTDLKTRQRNKLSSTCFNATCVVKSALKARGETSENMSITRRHLSRMLTDKLYPTPSEKKKD